MPARMTLTKSNTRERFIGNGPRQRRTAKTPRTPRSLRVWSMQAPDALCPSMQLRAYPTVSFLPPLAILASWRLNSHACTHDADRIEYLRTVYRRLGSEPGPNQSPWPGRKRHRALCGRLSGSGWESGYLFGRAPADTPIPPNQDRPAVVWIRYEKKSGAALTFTLYEIGDMLVPTDACADPAPGDRQSHHPLTREDD